MKTGRNLQEVLVELNRQNQAKQDFISPAQGMRLREDGQTFEINHLTTSQQEVFGTTSLFHRQVASALGIPAKYYDLMQAQKPELLAENVNSWFADKPSSYMVRSMDYGAGQVARALLSERYRRIDNMEIATAVLPLFAGNDQYEVMSCEVTENRLYLKVVNHRLEMEVRKGDIVQAGVMISNSEVGLGAVRLREDGQTFEINHLTTSQQEVFGTTSLFHRQVASALGIPAKYYDLMQKEKPELLAENVNSWFADKPSSYMVRSMDYGAGQVARALLSERYRRIDNMEIATSVLPLFAGNDQYEVMSCEVTENRLYLKVVNHRLEMEVRKGDIVQAGVMISNSEVGLGAVSIQPLVYRLVCTNGMVVNDMGERRHHVGRQAKAVEDSFALYSDETMEAEDKAFLLKLRDTTMAAIDEARFSQVVGRLQESMAVPITGRVQDVVQLTAQSYGINAEEQEGILKYLIEGGDLSLYGLSNAVTRASQDVVSYDRATTLEGIGWQVATMEPQQWKQINQ